MSKKGTILKIFFSSKNESEKIPVEELNLISSLCYKLHTVEDSRITNLIFCDNKKIRELNKHYRKKNKATDVLSFPFDDIDLLGEIYISLEMAKKQAKEFKVSLKEEIVRLFVHGLLHLIGYDHNKKNDKELMQMLENFYCGICSKNKRDLLLIFEIFNQIQEIQMQIKKIKGKKDQNLKVFL